MYLKIALLAVSLVCLGLVVLNFKTFRAFRDLLPVLNRNRPFCHKPHTTIVCGEASGLTVVIQ